MSKPSASPRPFRPADDHAVAGSIARLAALDSEAIRLLGLFDSVTRLPNRLQFLEDFRRLSHAGDGGRIMLLVTLDDARHYNEILRALGHAFCEQFVRSGIDQNSPW